MELLGPTVLVIMLAILVRGGSAILITCTTSGTLNTTGSVQCHFSEDINSTRRNFNIIYYPFGPNMTADYSKSNQVLACNWVSQAPAVECNFKEGYTYPKEVGHTTTLTIVKVSEENFGFYICQLVPDMNYDVQLCNLSTNTGMVKGSEDKLEVPNTSHSSVIGIVVGACLFTGVIILIAIFVRRLRKTRNKREHSEGVEINLGKLSNQNKECVPLINQTPFELEVNKVVDKPTNFDNGSDVQFDKSQSAVPNYGIHPDSGAQSNSDSKDDALAENTASEQLIQNDNGDTVHKTHPDKEDVADAICSSSILDRLDTNMTSEKQSDSIKVLEVGQQPTSSYSPLTATQHVRLMDTHVLCQTLLGQGVKAAIVNVFSKNKLDGTNFETFFEFSDKLIKKKKADENDLEHVKQVLDKLKADRDEQDKL